MHADLLGEVSTADSCHVGWHSEEDGPVAELSVRVHTWKPQPAGDVALRGVAFTGMVAYIYSTAI